LVGRIGRILYLTRGDLNPVDSPQFRVGCALLSMTIDKGFGEVYDRSSKAILWKFSSVRGYS